MIRKVSIRYGVKHLLIGMLIVAIISWYATTANEWAVDCMWVLGAIFGVLKHHDKFSRFILWAGIGSAVALLMISPFTLVLLLEESGWSLSDYTTLELAQYFLLWGLTLIVVGFVSGAVSAMLVWPFLLVVRRWMGFVDHIARPMNQEP